jgi:hypothetical protein
MPFAPCSCWPRRRRQAGADRDIAERHNLPEIPRRSCSTSSTTARAEPARQARRLQPAQAGVEIRSGRWSGSSTVRWRRCRASAGWRTASARLPGRDSCAIRRVFALTHQVTTTVLDRTTLADASRETPSSRLSSAGRRLVRRERDRQHSGRQPQSRRIGSRLKNRPPQSAQRRTSVDFTESRSSQ